MEPIRKPPQGRRPPKDSIGLKAAAFEPTRLALGAAA